MEFINSRKFADVSIRLKKVVYLMVLEIRKATEADIPDIAEIHVAGWQGAYGGIVDQDYLDGFTVDMRIEKWQEHFDNGESQAMIAYLEGKAVGFVDYGPLRTAPAGTSKIRPLYSSEIYALYLKPDYLRQGIGTALIVEAVQALKIQKHQSMCLWVLKDNKRGCAFYDALGGQRVGKMMTEIGTTKAKEVCYAWRDLSLITKV